MAAWCRPFFLSSLTLSFSILLPFCLLLLALDPERGGVNYRYYHNFSSCGERRAGSDGQILHGSILQVKLDFPAAGAVAGDRQIDRAALAHRVGSARSPPPAKTADPASSNTRMPWRSAAGDGYRQGDWFGRLGRLGGQTAEAEKRQRRHDGTEGENPEQPGGAVLRGMIGVPLGALLGVSLGAMIAVETGVAVEVASQVAVKIHSAAHIMGHVHVESLAAKPQQAQRKLNEQERTARGGAGR